jgi:hypothetical protein
LKIRAAAFGLNCYFLRVLNKRQENINIISTDFLMADIDLRCACLRGIIPKQILQARITARGAGICFVIIEGR